MKILGITGGIGSGKSLVSSVFVRLGVPVYYADKAGKQILAGNPEVKEKVVEILGLESYSGEKPNNKYIANRVFNDGSKLEELNRIIHPAVRQDFLEWLKQQFQNKYVIEEAAILFESGAWKFMDKILAVIAPDELRIKRVMKRDGVSRQDVLRRMEQQWPQDELAKRCDFLIHNDGSQLILPQILQIHDKMSNKNQEG